MTRITRLPPFAKTAHVEAETPEVHEHLPNGERVPRRWLEQYRIASASSRSG